MRVERKTLAEITKRAIEVLARELGSSDTIRFMNQFTRGSGNYTLERDFLFEDVTIDQIITEIKQSPRSRSDAQAPTED